MSILSEVSHVLVTLAIASTDDMYAGWLVLREKSGPSCLQALDSASQDQVNFKIEQSSISHPCQGSVLNISSACATISRFVRPCISGLYLSPLSTGPLNLKALWTQVCRPAPPASGTVDRSGLQLRRCGQSRKTICCGALPVANGAHLRFRTPLRNTTRLRIASENCAGEVCQHDA